MLCERESLFTNRTRVPGEMVSCVALTPADVIVMVVAALPPPPPPDGEDGEPAAAGGERNEHEKRHRSSRTHARALLATPAPYCDC